MNQFRWQKQSEERLREAAPGLVRLGQTELFCGIAEQLNAELSGLEAFVSTIPAFRRRATVPSARLPSRMLPSPPSEQLPVVTPKRAQLPGQAAHPRPDGHCRQYSPHQAQHTP
jgi:hypothetical protein